MERPTHKDPAEIITTRRAAPLSPALNMVGTTVDAVRALARFRKEILEEKAAHPEANLDHHLPRIFGEVGGLITNQLGWTVTSNADSPEFPQWHSGDRAIHLANHPMLGGGFAWGNFMVQHLTPHMGMVGKEAFLTNPLYYRLLGELVEALDASTFIQRSDHEGSRGAIGERAGDILKPGRSTVIFPDQHRPYDWRVMHERWKWDRKLPDLNVKTWMTETCFPRAGGLWELARAVEDDTRFFDSTIVEPANLYGGEFHVEVQELSREELFGDFSDERHLRRKLVELWMRKNEIIRKKRG